MSLELLTAKDLILGDVVEYAFQGHFPYSTMTVYKITETTVYTWRPYIHTSDFSCGDAVIPYIGIETQSFLKEDNLNFRLFKRNKNIK